MEPIRIISTKSTPPLGFAFSLAQQGIVTVPFGLTDFKGRMASQCIQFNYDLPKNSASVELLIFGDDDNLIIHFDVPQEFCRTGSYQIDWDGFDEDGCYDSSYLVRGHLRAVLRCDFDSGQEIKELKLKCKYAQVNWLDVFVNRKLCLITATLRVHFKSSKLKRENPAFYDTLHRLALEGISDYWSRQERLEHVHSLLLSGKLYNFTLKAVDHREGAMKTPKIVLAKGDKVRRSRNWEFSRILFYTAPVTARADAVFKHTAAHEIGHEILLAYGGHVHSKSHKGSSTIFSQRPNGKFTFPAKGEIDLMVYYGLDPQHPFPSDYFKRSIASESDVKSLLWLSQLKTTQIL